MLSGRSGGKEYAVQELNTNVTVMQDQRLQQLKARNDRQDELINQIDVTVDRLKDKAERINEEVVMQWA